jgi:hypothetical protein
VVIFLRGMGGADYPGALGSKEFRNCSSNGTAGSGYYCHCAIKSADNEPPLVISNANYII